MKLKFFPLFLLFLPLLFLCSCKEEASTDNTSMDFQQQSKPFGRHE